MRGDRKHAAGPPASMPEGTAGPGKRRRRELTPVQRALGLLVRREHSRQELDRKLRAKGIPDDEAAAAVRKMSDSGWQDDARFAVSLARTRANNGYGPIRIRAELGTHGLEGGAIEGAFDALAEAGEDDWLANARSLIQRRFGEAALDIRQQRKAADLLLRRGFDGGSVRAALGSGFDDE